MTLNLEDEYGLELGIDYEGTASLVISQVLEEEGCPYEAEVNLLLTSNEEIHRMNREYRDVDRPTDVLSFPQVEYESPVDFSWAEAHERDCLIRIQENCCLEISLSPLIRSKSRRKNMDMASGENMLSVAHSMLHLLGYDHMTEDEAKDMETRQSAVLEHLNITR